MVLYPVLCTVISVLLLAALMRLLWPCPSSAIRETPPTTRYPSAMWAQPKRRPGAGNVIAGMILNYKGFDTFGESCVLFLSVCVMLLLMPGEGRKGRARRAGQSERILSQPGVQAYYPVRTLLWRLHFLTAMYRRAAAFPAATSERGADALCRGLWG